MEDLYKLYKINIMNKYDKYFSMFKSKKELDILPDHILLEYNTDNKKAESEVYELDKKFKYVDVFNKKQDIFSSLFSTKINKISYKVFKELEKNETVLSNLKSFKPVNGYAKKVEYDQIKTITGRLVNKNESPKILTLPSKYRKIFESRWLNNGEILQIDFKSLEPRVIRKINGKESGKDIYSDIASNLEFEVDRIIIKRAIISILYGSNSQIEGLGKERSNIVLDAVNEYFNIKSIIEKASIEYDVDCRSNFYGRPIWNIKEEKTNKIVNNYIQSTAVDISLLYFSELSRKFNLELCKPIFMIHDALICDVNKEYKKEFLNIVNNGFTCSKLGNFPVEVTNILESLYE